MFTMSMWVGHFSWHCSDLQIFEWILIEFQLHITYDMNFVQRYCAIFEEIGQITL